MQCKKCGKRIIFLSDMGRTKSECKKCEKKYYREYYKKNKQKHIEAIKTNRWLNGAERRDDMGDNISYKLKSVNGVAHI